MFYFLKVYNLDILAICSRPVQLIFFFKNIINVILQFNFYLPFIEGFLSLLVMVYIIIIPVFIFYLIQCFVSSKFVYLKSIVCQTIN